MRNNKREKVLRLVIWAGILAAPANAALAAENAGCPSPNDASALTAWRDQIVTSANWPASDNAIASTIKKLDDCYGGRKKIPACFGRLYDYAEQRYTRSSGEPVKAENELNMRRPPEIFRAPNTSSSGEPGLILFQKEPYKDAEQIAKENGWPVVRYKSRHSGGFDQETASLLMIHVPGAKRNPPVDYDQYINIALPADPEDHMAAQANVAPIPKQNIPRPEQYVAENGSGAPMPKTTTILTVRKGKPGEQPLVLFNKFSRFSGEDAFRPNHESALNCYGCHPNGMRAIAPLGFSLTEDEHQRGQEIPPDMWKVIQDMNASMNLNQRFTLPSFGNVRTSDGKIRPLLNVNGLGPLVGPLRPLLRKVSSVPDGTKKISFPTRTKTFIDGPGGCAKQEKEINVPDIFRRAAGSNNNYKWNDQLPFDWKKVSKAMNCASCHNNEVHGALNGTTSWSTIQFKVLVDKSMPLWAHRNPAERASASDPAVQDTLNLNERIALINCLAAEFNEEKTREKEWLTEQSCRKPAANAETANPPADGSAEGTGAFTTEQGSSTPAQ